MNRLFSQDDKFYAIVFLLVTICVMTVARGFMNDSLNGAEGGTPPGFAVVELFTSQGCSSCPPADEVLQQLQAAASRDNLPVYCLSLHVDYWNKLGWVDPQSRPEFTRRQQQYASAFESKRVYTPQMVINGTHELIGSKRTEAFAAVRKAISTAPKLQFSATRQELADRQWLNYRVHGSEEGHVLIVASLLDKVSNSVPRGENAGRSLSHVQVVQSLAEFPIGTNGQGVIDLSELSLSPADESQLLVFVQHRPTMRIDAATRVNW